MSLPKLAEAIEDTPSHKKWLAIICLTFGFVGFVFDVGQRHSTDETNHQLLGNVNLAVNNTNELVQKTTNLATSTSQMATIVSTALPQIAELNTHMVAIDKQLKTTRDPRLIADLQVQKAQLQKQADAANQQLLLATVTGIAHSLTNVGQSWYNEEDKAITEFTMIFPRPTSDERQERMFRITDKYLGQVRPLMVAADFLRQQLLQKLSSGQTPQDKAEAVIFAKGVAGQPLQSLEVRQAGNYLLNDLAKRVGLTP